MNEINRSLKGRIIAAFQIFDSVYVESHICILHSSTYREPGEFDLIISSSFPMPGCLTPGIMVFSMSMIQYKDIFLGLHCFRVKLKEESSCLYAICSNYEVHFQKPV